MPNSSVLLLKIGLFPGETRRGEISSSVSGFGEAFLNMNFAKPFSYNRRWRFSLERWWCNGGNFALGDQVRVTIINLSRVLLARFFAFIENLILLLLTKVATTAL